MAGDTKVTDLAAKSAPVAADLCMIVDLEDTSMAPTGTNKKSTFANIATSIAAILGLKSASTKAASGAGATVASLAGATVVGHLATFTDTAGTIGDGGPIPTVPPIPPATVPAGATGQIQYNNAGAFGGSPALIVGAGSGLTVPATTTILVSGGTGNLTIKDDATTAGYNLQFQRANSSSLLQFACVCIVNNQQTGTGSFYGYFWSVAETSVGSGSKYHTAWGIPGGATPTALDRFARPVFAPIAPTVAVGPGAGTGAAAAAAIVGSDIAGFLYVNTGTAPTAGGVVATVTFKNPYFAVPSNVMLTPASVAAADPAAGAIAYVPASFVTATGFSLYAGTVALAANGSYVWAYRVNG